MRSVSGAQTEAIKEVRTAQEYAALSRDPRMAQLFSAFDRNHDGVIDFKVKRLLVLERSAKVEC
jgi:hypothetical protein